MLRSIVYATFASLYLFAPTCTFAQDINGDEANLGGANGMGDEQEPFIQFTANDDVDAIFSWIWSRADGRLQFAHDSRTYLTIDAGARTDTMRINDMGVGIGTTVPSEALHVSGGGASPFSRARVLIQDSNAAAAQRLLLHLKNNGGSRLDFQNTDSGHRFNLKTDSNDTFIMGKRIGGIDQFAIESETPAHAVHTSMLGVGINTETPSNALHVFTDGVTGYTDGILLVENASPTVASRDLFRLKNNGGCKFRMLNADSGISWLFQSSTSDNFTIKTSQAGGPAFGIKNDGTLTMNSGGGNKLKLSPNGNLLIAGTLSQSSDRNMKENFKEVDTQEVLKQVVKLPVTTWNFKHDEKSVRHMGPMSQDFKESFGLGEDAKTIAPLDTIGVAIASVQALNEQLEAKEERIAELEASLKRQQTKSVELSDRLVRLESIVAEVVGGQD